MLPRSLAMPTLLVAAVAVPYAVTNAPQWKQQWMAPSQAGAAPPAAAPQWPSAPGAKPAASPATWSPSGQAAAVLPSSVAPGGQAAVVGPTPLEGMPSYSLDTVLRMDVTKEWVYQRWPRKSTALSELDLYGVRVPLVTGTQVFDLAGSLTYFFGPDGRVQRISFRGRTGDTTQLVSLVTQRYGLAWQTPTTAGEQLLEVRSGEDVFSRLRSRPAPVLWTNTPNESFAIELDLQDPARARPLPPLLPVLPPAAAAAAKQNDSKKAADAKKTDEPPPVTGWKAFFPRSRVPEGQLKGLDANNQYP